MSPGTYSLSRYAPVIAWTCGGLDLCPACAAARWDTDELAKGRAVMHTDEALVETVRPLFAEGDPETSSCLDCGETLRLGGEL